MFIITAHPVSVYIHSILILKCFLSKKRSLITSISISLVDAPAFYQVVFIPIRIYSTHVSSTEKFIRLSFTPGLNNSGFLVHAIEQRAQTRSISDAFISISVR